MSTEQSALRAWGNYRDVECPRCGRYRVQDDGVCEKCLWDTLGNNFAAITRPEEYNSQGPILVDPNDGLSLS